MTVGLLLSARVVLAVFVAAKLESVVTPSTVVVEGSVVLGELVTVFVISVVLVAAELESVVTPAEEVGGSPVVIGEPF